MFTGLIEELGSFLYREGKRFRFESDLVLEETKIDDSISVNGCCLTVVDIGDGWWEADAVEETVSRTSLGDLVPGDSINLERAVRSVDRLGGHMVQGHVDGVGTIVSPGPDLRIRMPKEMARYLVEKGSITVDGVSLTCFDVQDDSFAIALIPHTMDVTSLGIRKVGDRVNLEVDIIAKYVERMLIPHLKET
ncbi:MAG: riboflavin synthase [Actinomycetota bacterium]|nr:riboflavin synthase [Actinomycetota bacterium]MDG2121906.1 riboflavin synthase [Actinomycetota bacterium]